MINNSPAGAEDTCPHCSPTHARPESRPWGVFTSPHRDGDGQPTHLLVHPSNGAHVAQSDADWLSQLILDYRSNTSDRMRRFIPAVMSELRASHQELTTREQHLLDAAMEVHLRLRSGRIEHGDW